MTDTADGRAYRLTNIDMVRGLAIVLMAIDHVRDFFLTANMQDPMNDPNVAPSLYLTRWVTHFCAPTFVLFAGTSAGLMATRKSRSELGAFLFKRGLWLLFVEVAIISPLTTFSPFGMPQLGGKVLAVMQVIYAIGVSMMVLAAVQFVGRRATLALGLVIFFGHNLLDSSWPATTLFDTQWPLWAALHSQMSMVAGPFILLFAYPLLPWVGVMLVGFGLAEVFERPPREQETQLLRIGGAMFALFLLLRGLDGYGDTNHWQSQPAGALSTLMDFFNTSKYGPSLQFLLMILGPALVLTAFAGRWSGKLKDALVVFGRVPFAFYVTHWLVIHTLSVLLGVVQGFPLSEMATHFVFYPKGYGVSLPLVYVVWAVIIASLYPFCRWVSGVKARRRDWWLSYL